MRLLDIFSRHPRGDISAHADGELASDRLDALEAHLAGCERCHTELDDLLAVRSALRDLPQVAAPRSFRLTPAMAERDPPPVTSRATPSFVAMRIAGAGFAAVLAIVVMLDAGGIVDDSGGRSDDSSTALFEADPTNRGIEATGGSLTEDDAGAPSTGGDGDLPAAGGVGGAPDGLELAPDSDDEEPPLNQLPADGEQEPPDATTTPDDGARPNNLDGDDAEAAAPEPGDGAAAALTAEDDGVSALLVIEIGLAAIAVLAIGGSFVMRRRAERE